MPFLVPLILLFSFQAQATDLNTRSFCQRALTRSFSKDIYAIADRRLEQIGDYISKADLGAKHFVRTMDKGIERSDLEPWVRSQLNDHLISYLNKHLDLEPEMLGAAVRSVLRSIEHFTNPGEVDEMAFESGSNDLFDLILKSSEANPKLTTRAWQAAFPAAIATLHSAKIDPLQEPLQRALKEWNRIRHLPLIEFEDASEDLDASETTQWIAFFQELREALLGQQDPYFGFYHLGRVSRVYGGRYASTYLHELIFLVELESRVITELGLKEISPLSQFAFQVVEGFEPTHLGPQTRWYHMDVTPDQKRHSEFQLKYQRWQAGVVLPGEEKLHALWVYTGKTPLWKWQQILEFHMELDKPGSLESDAMGSAKEVRDQMLGLYPEDSPAYKRLTQNAGVLTQIIETGSGKLPLPLGLMEVWPGDVPAQLHFSKLNHYDEHIWERIESRRQAVNKLARNSPELITHQFAELTQAIQGGAQAPADLKTMLKPESAIPLLEQIKKGLARETKETTVWSLSKRNFILENLTDVIWTELPGRASGNGNLLFQGDYKGTRFFMAVCGGDNCTDGKKRGEVASIYPVCGKNVYVVPRVSKLDKVMAMLANPPFKMNKDLREALVREKLCPQN